MPFSQRVAEATWLEEATTWITGHVDAHGLRLTGAIEQRRIRPWSTQLIVPTDAGWWWFKANCRSMSFEPALHEVLADLTPHSIAALIATDTGRGWLLTADQGSSLLDDHEPTLEDWRLVVRALAEAQIVLAQHRDRLLVTGLPDCAPGTTLGRFDRLIEVYADLPEEHPAHVTPELAGRLRAERPRLADAAARLEESTLPATWQHGDLHPGNAFVTDGTTRLFDFGDSQWAHALEALIVPFGVVTGLSDLPWKAVLGEYADAWQVELPELSKDWEAVGLTHAVNRSLTWWRCLAEAAAKDWEEWGEAPRVHLMEVLDP